MGRGSCGRAVVSGGQRHTEVGLLAMGHGLQGRAESPVRRQSPGQAQVRDNETPDHKRHACAQGRSTDPARDSITRRHQDVHPDRRSRDWPVLGGEIVARHANTVISDGPIFNLHGIQKSAKSSILTLRYGFCSELAQVAHESPAQVLVESLHRGRRRMIGGKSRTAGTWAIPAAGRRRGIAARRCRSRSRSRDRGWRCGALNHLLGRVGHRAVRRSRRRIRVDRHIACRRRSRRWSDSDIQVGRRLLLRGRTGDLHRAADHRADHKRCGQGNDEPHRDRDRQPQEAAPGDEVAGRQNEADKGRRRTLRRVGQGGFQGGHGPHSRMNLGLHQHLDHSIPSCAIGRRPRFSWHDDRQTRD